MIGRYRGFACCGGGVSYSVLRKTLSTTCRMICSTSSQLPQSSHSAICIAFPRAITSDRLAPGGWKAAQRTAAVISREGIALPARPTRRGLRGFPRPIRILPVIRISRQAPIGNCGTNWQFQRQSRAHATRVACGIGISGRYARIGRRLSAESDNSAIASPSRPIPSFDAGIKRLMLLPFRLRRATIAGGVRTPHSGAGATAAVSGTAITPAI